jgi:hypothetical protein
MTKFLFIGLPSTSLMNFEQSVFCAHNVCLEMFEEEMSPKL